MQALKRRRERWEYENQLRLEWVVGSLQQNLRKPIPRLSQLLSFLLYLVYGGGRWLMRVSRVLWLPPEGLEQRYRDAEQQRLRLESNPSRWLK